MISERNISKLIGKILFVYLSLFYVLYTIIIIPILLAKEINENYTAFTMDYYESCNSCKFYLFFLSVFVNLYHIYLL